MDIAQRIRRVADQQAILEIGVGLLDTDHCRIGEAVQDGGAVGLGGVAHDAGSHA